MTTTAAKPRRQWFQFSLMQLLIAVLVTGSCLGLLAARINKTQRERRAVAEIESLGSDVYFDWQIDDTTEPAGPKLLRRVLGDDFFSSVARVDLNGGQISDECLIHLKPFSDLSEVWINATRISDEGIRYLTRFKKVRLFSFSGTGLTNAGLAHFKELTSLEVLGISCPSVSDAGLIHLHDCAALRNVYIYNSSVTDAGLADLQKAMPNCKIEQ
jgi:hypothetical protein